MANKDMRKQLDQAVWRRDEIHLTMCSPNQRIYTAQDLAEAEDDVEAARARLHKMLNPETPETMTKPLMMMPDGSTQKCDCGARANWWAYTIDRHYCYDCAEKEFNWKPLNIIVDEKVEL